MTLENLEQGTVNEASEVAYTEVEGQDQDSQQAVGDGGEVEGQEVQGQEAGRTIEEKVEVLKEVYGLSNEDLVTTKSGEIKIIQKINGKSYLVTPKQMAKGFGLQQAGYQKLNEAKQTIKSVHDFNESIKTNPQNLWKLADELQINKYDLAEQLLRGATEEYEMTPEERRAAEVEREKEALRLELEQLKGKEKDRIFQQEKQASMKKYDQELTSAMKMHGFTKAPSETKSEVLVGAIKKLMLANSMDRDMSAEEAVYLAKQDWEEHVLGFFDDIDDDHIIKIVPERIIEAIRKADLSNLEKDSIPTVNSQIDSDSDEVDLEEYDPRGKKKKQSISDYFATI